LSTELTPELRQLVHGRANGRCEYCLLPESFAVHRHEPDHIIPRQHDGPTTEDNLALACMRCNRHKGPNIGSLDPLTGQLVLFFNPRTQSWATHFRLEDGYIQPLTPEARVTVKIFHLNDAHRVQERVALIKAKRY
jgi:hypothetical protein